MGQYACFEHQCDSLTGTHIKYLQKDRHKLVRDATAAERRKLSIEIALIGDPQVRDDPQEIKTSFLHFSFMLYDFL
jgi:hypothetical protein